MRALKTSNATIPINAIIIIIYYAHPHHLITPNATKLPNLQRAQPYLSGWYPRKVAKVGTVWDGQQTFASHGTDTDRGSSGSFASAYSALSRSQLKDAERRIRATVDVSALLDQNHHFQPDSRGSYLGTLNLMRRSPPDLPAWYDRPHVALGGQTTIESFDVV
uniref:Uncharacterized protein n=1 Tax=Anopheles maculatus TaxID=74869 RepID=A0A182SDH8_9DIPT